jgi:hypothetical protein
MTVGLAGTAETLTATDKQVVKPQDPPSARTKYVVVAVGITAMVAPVPTLVPKPQPFLYHFHTAPDVSVPVTDKVTALPAQMDVDEAVTVCGPQG